MKNTGYGFDAATLQGVMPDATSARGRGVAIMRALMDQVDFSSGEASGTIVTLAQTLAVDSDSLLDRLRRTRAPSS